MEMQAGSLLLIPGQLPVCRVKRELQPPLSKELLTPDDTRAVAEPLLTEAMSASLETTGSVELPFDIAGASGDVTVFLGQGHYHLVFYLAALKT